MSYFSKITAIGTLLIAISMLSGCIQDSPHDTDMPWSGRESWEGTMPLPSSIRNQYE